MSPLPRLAAPRGPSQRIAAMLPRGAAPSDAPAAQLELPLAPLAAPLPAAERCRRCLSPSRPRVTAAWCAVCRDGHRERRKGYAAVARGEVAPPAAPRGRPPEPEGKPRPASTRMRGPILLQPAPPGATGEQRIGECPREARCVEDWLAQGRQGQARCPAGCGVWGAMGSALDGAT